MRRTKNQIINCLKAYSAELSELTAELTCHVTDQVTLREIVGRIETVQSKINDLNEDLERGFYE